MKAVIKTIQVDHRLTTEIVFTDYAINKFHIKEGKRKDFKFKNTQVAYLNGLRLRYSPFEHFQIFKNYYPSSYLRQNILFLLLPPTNFKQD